MQCPVVDNISRIDLIRSGHGVTAPYLTIETLITACMRQLDTVQTSKHEVSLVNFLDTFRVPCKMDYLVSD